MSERIRLQEELKLAIINEITAQKLYRSLAEVCFKETPKERILAILEDEKGHEAELRNHYKTCFGKEPDLKDMEEPKLPEVSPDPATTRQVLEFAINEEIEAAELYGRYAGEATEEDAQRMFQGLREMELEHRTILQRELDNLILGMDWFTIENARPMED